MTPKQGEAMSPHCGPDWHTWPSDSVPGAHCYCGAVVCGGGTQFGNDWRCPECEKLKARYERIEKAAKEYEREWNSPVVDLVLRTRRRYELFSVLHALAAEEWKR